MYTGDYDDHEDKHEAPDQNTCVGKSDEIEEGRTLDSNWLDGFETDNTRSSRLARK